MEWLHYCMLALWRYIFYADIILQPQNRTCKTNMQDKDRISLWRQMKDFCVVKFESMTVHGPVLNLTLFMTSSRSLAANTWGTCKVCEAMPLFSCSLIPRLLAPCLQKRGYFSCLFHVFPRQHGLSPWKKSECKIKGCDYRYCDYR